MITLEDLEEVYDDLESVSFTDYSRIYNEALRDMKKKLIERLNNGN